MPLFVPDKYVTVTDLTVGLSQVLFPILVLLGVTGMVVGILNSYDRFGVFAISPFFWNVAIIAVLVGLAPAFPEDEQIYAYAIGVLVGTAIQLAMPLFDLRNTPFGLRRALTAPFRVRRADWRDSNVRRVLLLMLPVTLSLGLINFNLLDQQHGGVPRLRRGARRDRQGVPHLHAAAGHLLGGGDHGPLSDHGPARGAARLRGPARDDGQRHAADRPAAGPGRGGDPRPLGADGAARLPAGRVRRRVDRPGGHGAVLVRLLASLQRPLPAAHPDLLQPPASLGPNGDLGDQPRDHRARRPGPLRALRGRRDRRRDGDRDRGQRARADDRPAPPARPARARQAGLDDGPRRRRGGGARRRLLRGLVRPRRGARAERRRPDRLAERRPRGGGGACTPPRSPCSGSRRPSRSGGSSRRREA